MKSSGVRPLTVKVLIEPPKKESGDIWALDGGMRGETAAMMNNAMRYD